MVSGAVSVGDWGVAARVMACFVVWRGVRGVSISYAIYATTDDNNYIQL
jgi:hypothetical protein